MHNLGKEIDNLHKNVVNVENERVIKTTARNDIGGAASSNITDSDSDVEEQNKGRINDINLELGAKAYRYQMLVSAKFRNTRDKDKIIAEWKAFRNRLLEAAEYDSRIPKLISYYKPSLNFWPALILAVIYCCCKYHGWKSS